MNRFHWTEAAKRDLRRIDREQAITILRALTEYGDTGQGAIKQLRGSSDYRLRIGDYRVRFELLTDGALLILQVKHRREAYR